jgi:RsiW-degrading membrane proteinase PrsW (M82 family)
MNDLNTKTSETIGSTGEVGTAGAAYWSDRAVRRLAQARVIGLLAAAIGALSFAIGEAQNSVVSSLMSSSGLALSVVGVIVFAAAVRTRGSRPDRSFTPQSITTPRMWFVLTWGAGIAVAALLLALKLPAVVEQLIMLIFSVSLMLAGSVWAVRWLSGQRIKFWPIGSDLLVRWMPNWTVLWAGVWGAASTFLAIMIEAAPLVLLALLSGRAFTNIPETRLSSFEGLDRAMNNPLLLILIFLGAVIGAPIIEEAVKAAGLRGLRHWIQQPADGWLLGFAAGLGFGLLEGAFNLNSADNWFLGSWVRLAALLLHGLATSLTGLGYARYRQTHQRGELWRGYGHAVMMHGLWNAGALAIAFVGFQLSFHIFRPNILLLCLAGPLAMGAIVLMVLLLRRVAKAGAQSSIQEDYQQAGVPLPSGWSPMPFNLGWRLVGRRPIVVPPTAQADAPLNSSSANPSDDPYSQRVEEDLKSE